MLPRCPMMLCHTSSTLLDSSKKLDRKRGIPQHGRPGCCKHCNGRALGLRRRQRPLGEGGVGTRVQGVRHCGGVCGAAWRRTLPYGRGPPRRQPQDPGLCAAPFEFQLKGAASCSISPPFNQDNFVPRGFRSCYSSCQLFPISTVVEGIAWLMLALLAVCLDLSVQTTTGWKQNEAFVSCSTSASQKFQNHGKGSSVKRLSQTSLSHSLYTSQIQ